MVKGAALNWYNYAPLFLGNLILPQTTVHNNFLALSILLITYRKDSNTVLTYEKRRLEMKERIRAVFNESHQRFGANKTAVLSAEQGIRASPKYVAELFREMELQGVSL